MQRLILHPTCLAQWHALLLDAQKTCAISLKEDIESYLIFLLMRFMDNPSIASSVLGLDFLNSTQQLTRLRQHQMLKEVGDKCLLFAGLFPGHARKRRVKLSYFVKLGQMAYSMVSQQPYPKQMIFRLGDEPLSNRSVYENSSAKGIAPQEALFDNLCLQFPQLMDVLQAMRENTYLTTHLLETFELWQETGSQMAWQRLCKATTGLPFSPSGKKSSH